METSFISTVPQNGGLVAILPDNGSLAGASFGKRDEVQPKPDVKNSPGKMQACRFEYKYLINERLANRLRPEILMYVYPDEFTTPEKIGKGYLTNSLYLDSPKLSTFWDTENGNRNRFKIRVRFYDDDPHTPAFLEVKRRREEIIYKTRAMVTKESVNRFIKYNVLPTEDDLIKPSPAHIAGLFNFNRLVTIFMARPAVYTSYYREGFEPRQGNWDRVTFDRDLRTGRITDRLSTAGREEWKKVQMGPDPDSLVFEMKFTNVSPPWMHGLVRRHDLVREAFQKYGGCVKVMRPELAYLSPTYCRVPDYLERSDRDLERFQSELWLP